MLKIGIFPPALEPSAASFIRDAEKLGVDSLWAPEAWMYDALTPLAFFASATEQMRLATGCVQLGARTPALLAMSALTMQKMSGGRFILGVGTSGPQVMEGWHGVRFDKPVTRTRETIEIIRTIVSGERLSYDGAIHQLPLPDSQGRALRSPVAEGEVPIYIASMGPANLKLTGAASDGWIGTAFLPESADIFTDPIREGAEAAGRSLADIEQPTDYETKRISAEINSSRFQTVYSFSHTNPYITMDGIRRTASLSSMAKSATTILIPTSSR